MRTKLSAIVVVALLAAWSTGCSGSSAGSTSFNIFKNLSRKDTNLRVFLDGQEATQSKLKKGLKGYAAFKVAEPVSTSPVFKYEIIEPKEMGDIMSVHLQVHQKFEADFSDLADYTIHATDINDRSQQMKPGVAYELGDLGDQFTIHDKSNRQVDAVEFVPGQEYLLVFTIRADKSETIQVYFQTN